MTTRKRNVYLDAGVSDDEASSGYDSGAAQEAKGSRAAIPRSKRRKIGASASASEDESEFGSISSKEEAIKSPRTTFSASVVTTTHPTPPPSNPQAKPRPLSIKKSSQKKGVIYLSRIPPYMRPTTVRTLLSPHGTITNLFLTPEPPSAYLSRRKSGGNRKKSFIDGWVEFSRRRDAKICVEAINGRIVGGKKGGYYRDDVWNARYLRGFGWGDLMESVRREEREREERVRVGLRREGRERKEFLLGIERSKVQEGRRRKREGRVAGGGQDEEGGGEGKGSDAVGDGDEDGKKKATFERRFRQNEVKQKGKGGKPSEDVKRVLSKIF